MTNNLNMNPHIEETFNKIKPVCDMVFKDPSPKNLATFNSIVDDMREDIAQELQQYLLYPLTTLLQSLGNKKYQLQQQLVESVKGVIQKVEVTNYEICLKVESLLLTLILDSTQPGMIANMPEELKLSVVECLTTLMLNIDQVTRIKMLEDQVPVLAQAIFLLVHLAKLEKLRTLRLAALTCLAAHTVTHPQLTNVNDHISDPLLEKAVVNMMASVLPGVLSALHDVAMCPDNPGHSIVVAALRTTHRVLCIIMHSKHLPTKYSVVDFVQLFAQFNTNDVKDVDSKETNTNDITKCTPDWYAMTSEKIAIVVKNLVTLVMHEHFRVRKELAVLCNRIVSECSATMQPSMTMALDVLISLSTDPYPEVSNYCTRCVAAHFASANPRRRAGAVDALCDNFFTTLFCLPKILNSIDSSRKLSTLGLIHGYLHLLCGPDRPQRLTNALSGKRGYARLCHALVGAANVRTDLNLLTKHAGRCQPSRPPTDTPWCRLRKLDCVEGERRLQQICQMLGAAECAEVLLDSLMERFHEKKSCELVYIINWVGSAPNSPPSLAKRIINTYIMDEIWYLPLEVSRGEAPLTKADTLDTSVYDPRAWTKDSVPGLYEGATETRYTDISYAQPRTRYVDPNKCATLAEAQKNMALCCLFTEGLGMMARRLENNYQPYLLKTLCLILERVSSQYDNFHLAGLKAIHNVARAFNHSSVTHLITQNVDYLTYQITSQLKRARNTESALQILSVVMQYSDPRILDYLYGIVENVLVQCCDKDYEKHLSGYLQVFLTFVTYIRKWFPLNQNQVENDQETPKFDIIQDVIKFAKNKEEAERLLTESERERKMTAEELYREDTKKRGEEALDWNDTVAEESRPVPKHIQVTITILKRCINFMSSKYEDALVSIRILTLGLPLLREYENELLPMVHLMWSPLMGSFDAKEAAVLRCAFDLFVLMTELTKDFLRSRAVKDLLPKMYNFLKDSALDSHLKDRGSSYRLSHQFNLQCAVLTALPRLVMDLNLHEDQTTEAMTCTQVYLSNKQPKPLQMLAVTFFKDLLGSPSYYGCVWLHLRSFCNNAEVIHPPPAPRAEPRVPRAEPRVLRADPHVPRAEPRVLLAEPRLLRADPRVLRADPRVLLAEARVLRADPRVPRAEPLVPRAEPLVPRAEPLVPRAEPLVPRAPLQPARGSPYSTRDPDYDANVKLIFHSTDV